MLSRQQFDAAAFRLASYHLSLLKGLQDDFEQGQFQKRAEFEKHWSQIKQSHQFMSERLAYDAFAADYCLQFVLTSYDFLYVWRNLAETLQWVEVGIAASQQLDNQGLVDLLHHQISLYFVNKKLGLAQQKIDNLLHLATTLNAPLAKAHALLHRGRFHLTQGDYDEAQTFLADSANLYQQLDNQAQYGWVLYNLASIAEIQGKLDEAHQYIDNALQAYQAPQDLRRITLAKSRLGSIIEQQGDKERGFQYAEQALKSAYQLQDNMLIISSLMNLAIIVWEQGQQNLSLAYYEEANFLSRKIGAMPYQANALMNLGYINSNQGDFVRAEQYYTESMTTYHNLQYKRRAYVSQAYLCFAVVMNDKQAIAIANLCEAWQFGNEADDRLIRGLTLIALAAYLIKQNELHDAMICYQAIKAHHTNDDVSDALNIFEKMFPVFIHEISLETNALSLEDLYQKMEVYFCQ